MSATTAVEKPTSNSGLTKQGVVILQSLFIASVVVIEIVIRHGVGVFGGIAICVATLGAVRFGRKGTEYVSAATPPLAFALAATIALIATDGLHLSKLGVDFVAALASAAPYLILSASFGWINFLRARKNKAKSN